MAEASLVCEATVDDLTDSLPNGLVADLQNLCCYALTEEKQSGEWSISIVLTTDQHMTHLHNMFLEIPETTDILTFPFDDELGGEIAISVSQADRQREDDAWSLDDELRFLVAHGVLHLTGWEDTLPEERYAMLDRQRIIMAAYQDASSSTR